MLRGQIEHRWTPGNTLDCKRRSEEGREAGLLHQRGEGGGERGREEYTVVSIGQGGNGDGDG